MTATDYATLPPLGPVPQLAGTPIPIGRGRWTLNAYQRQFSTALPIPLAQLTSARSRRVEQKLNTPATLTFTLDGRSQDAALLTELATDVVAFRWDEAQGRDVPVFRGLVDHSQDQVTEQSHTVNFVAHDYFGILNRRFSTSDRPTAFPPQSDQDNLVTWLLQYATDYLTSFTGVSFTPGSYLPLWTSRCYPDGTTGRPLSGRLRDRIYQPATVYGQAIDDLANVINGFDYDVLARGPSWAQDYLRVFYPSQGVTRTDVALVYGVNVSTVDRTVSSDDYANYVRVIGNKSDSAPDAPQLFSEKWNTDANNVTVNPVGLWALVENASDVSQQATLDEAVAGSLDYHGLIVPSYTIGLRPGAYTWGLVNMGDTVRLAVASGRLNVSTMVRVVGISYAIGDDGDENVALTVGRAPSTLASTLTATTRDIDALARR